MAVVLSRFLRQVPDSRCQVRTGTPVWEFWGHNTVHSRPLLGRPGLPLLRSRSVSFSITGVNPSLPAGNPVLVASRSSVALLSS